MSNNHIKTQWTTEGFIQRYEELLPEYRTYLEAYVATEEEHKKLFGVYRYRSHEAFRQVRRSALSKKNV